MDPLAGTITDKALKAILLRYQDNDEILEAVKLINLLYVSEPSEDVAKEILNIIEPKEVFNNVGEIPEC